MAEIDPAAPTASPASAPQSESTADKDRVGEELADDARIWRVYDQVARADDKERIDTWNRGLDNLALFAGLFSAVTTAFIIEAQKDLKVDYSQLAFLALNASANGVPFVQQPFVIPSSARTTICLWVASLVLSLSAALIAIMGKDWIGMYAARPVCNARQWAEMRTYRLQGVKRWYMSGAIASAPVLLHVSLLLFGAGLVLFVSSDPLTQHLTLGLSLSAGGLSLVTALSAIVFPGSPFRSPATQMIRGAISAILHTLLSCPKRSLVTKLHAAISSIIAPDLNKVSRRQRRILRWNLNIIHHPGVPHPSLLPAAQSLLCRARDSTYTAPLSTWVASRYLVIETSRLMCPENIACAVRRLNASRYLLGSPWAEIPEHRSPEHLAKVLSWLSSASLAPEVLRAIIVALGDLEIGGQVAPLLSTDLRTRVRADIRFNWQKVDFVTLARYVRAERNLLEDPLVSEQQFRGRLDMQSEPALRCEDGLAALVMVCQFFLPARAVQQYCPPFVLQPRMFNMLLLYISQLHKALEPLVIILDRYRGFLTRDDVHEVHATFLRFFDPVLREEYKQTVWTRFGGQSGFPELLTYLIVEFPNLDRDVATAAMDLVLHALTRLSHKGDVHWCVAYLFSHERSASLWIDRSFTPLEAGQLLDSLSLWTYRQYKWDDNDTPQNANSRALESAIAQTVVNILSPNRWQGRDRWPRVSGSMRMTYQDLSARCLHVQLCNRHSLLAHGDKLTLIGGLLETAALSWIRDSSPFRDSFRYSHRPEYCVDILTATVNQITPLLRSEDTLRRGVELFGLLAHCETHTKDSSLVFWELGDYLREISTKISEPSIAGAIQCLLAEMQDLYPLCHNSEVLLIHWNRIGLPAAVQDWKYETDDELVAFWTTIRRAEGGAGDRASECVVGNGGDAMWWLEASMM